MLFFLLVAYTCQPCSRSMLVDVLAFYNFSISTILRIPQLPFQVAKGKTKRKALRTSSSTSSSDSDSESEMPGASTAHDECRWKVPTITDTKLITGVDCVILTVKEYERAIAARKIIHQSMLAEIKVSSSSMHYR